jgi:uncharacterized protein (TIGR02246 family)
MMRWNRFVSTLLLAACAGSAGAADCRSLASLDWLQGEWLADGKKSTWRESWTAIAPTTWEGRGVETSKADPARSSAEELRLVEMGDGVFYVAKVAHNELPVAFRLVECGPTRLVFANPGHDFPKQLEYERQADGRLRVNIGDGAGEGFTLDFVRVAPAAGDAEAVLAAEDERFAAMVAGDVPAMRRRMAEDLEYVHSTGKVETRGELVDGIVEGRLRYLSLAPSGREVRFLGPAAALVTGQAGIRAVAGATTADFDARYLAVYGFADGRWQLRAWQSLRLP